MKATGWKDIPIGGMILKAGNSVEYKTGGWRAFRPVHGEGKCIDCMQCWLFCPDSCIIVENEKMTGFNLDFCKGCGICAAVCPVNTKIIKKAEEKLSQDDPGLCIRMVEEGKAKE